MREALRRHAPELSSGLEAGLQGNGGMTLRSLTGLVPNGDALRADLAATLASAGS